MHFFPKDPFARKLEKADARQNLGQSLFLLGLTLGHHTGYPPQRVGSYLLFGSEG